ncbi:hypothetical protein SUGI_0188170 [Cryptomeria japonica]|uniref:cyclin-SDS-like n=1 Tax=Cryptomeria japonica TaxID=3369 RepID=UPI002408D0B2|nr:cyclin-SDS-like [Cryptomeria japonica]GLJ12292.1 hypothetical protein SUGI_0188170 [Cryptomeria japonica]
MVKVARKRKTRNRVSPPPQKRTKVEPRKQKKQTKRNVSSGSTALLHKGAGSASLIHRRNSAFSCNTLPSTSHSTLLQQPCEKISCQENLHSNIYPEPEFFSENKPIEAKFASSENSCLEREPAPAISEQFSSSRNNILTENCFRQNVIYPDQFSPSEPPKERKFKNSVQSSVYPGELSFTESVFDPEIETALSKLDHCEAAFPSPCAFSDATPDLPYYYSDYEVHPISPFFSASTDDLLDSAAHSSVLTCSSLITEYEEKFLSWKDFAYANLPELSFSITDLSESRTGNDNNEDFELGDDEDEKTFQKFRAKEGRQALFWDNMWNYLDSNLSDAIGQQRLVMINWIMEHTASNQLQWETLFLGANLMDRFLSKGTFPSDNRLLQVLGIACMTLAIRLEEKQPYNCIKQETFKIANNFFKRREVVAMEYLLLKGLNYRCYTPTIANFLWYYLKAARGDVELETTAKYLACMSLVDRQLLRFWPSTIASSLVILACQMLDRKDSYKLVIEKCRKDDDEDLKDCVERLEWLLENVW